MPFCQNKQENKTKRKIIGGPVALARLHQFLPVSILGEILKILVLFYSQSEIQLFRFFFRFTRAHIHDAAGISIPVEDAIGVVLMIIPAVIGKVIVIQSCTDQGRNCALQFAEDVEVAADVEVMDLNISIKLQVKPTCKCNSIHGNKNITK